MSVPFYRMSIEIDDRSEDFPCATLLYACLNNRIIIIKHLLETGEFDDCILEIIRLLVTNNNYRHICDYYKKDNDSQNEEPRWEYEAIRRRFEEQNLPQKEWNNFLINEWDRPKKICNKKSKRTWF